MNYLFRYYFHLHYLLLYQCQVKKYKISDDKGEMATRISFRHRFMTHFNRTKKCWFPIPYKMVFPAWGCWPSFVDEEFEAATTSWCWIRLLLAIISPRWITYPLFLSKPWNVQFIKKNHIRFLKIHIVNKLLPFPKVRHTFETIIAFAYLFMVPFPTNQEVLEPKSSNRRTPSKLLYYEQSKAHIRLKELHLGN